MTGKELSRNVEERFSQYVYDLTGVELDYRQTKLVMDAAIKIPLRHLLEVAKQEKVDLEDISIATSYGKVSLKSRELTTGAVGEAKEKVLDEEGNAVLKYYPKISLARGIKEEIAVETGFNDEDMADRVAERSERENGYYEAYKAGTDEWEKYTVEDAFVEEMRALFKKFSKKELGIDPTKKYASEDWNEKEFAGKGVSTAAAEDNEEEDTENLEENENENVDANADENLEENEELDDLM